MFILRTLTNSTKLITFGAKILGEFKSSGISTLTIDTTCMSRPPRDPYLSNSNSNIDARILAQGYSDAIVSLSLLLTSVDIEQEEIRKALLIKQKTE